MKITVGVQEIDLETRAAVMSIINVTPDSFYEDSRSFDSQTIRQNVDKALTQGCQIIDLGAYSSRPGASEVSVEEEICRLEMGMQTIREMSDVVVSIDTFRAEVVEAIYARFGAFIVNDITGGADENMYATVARLRLPYVCMHMRGTPETMQSMTDYNDLVGEVEAYFEQRIEKMKQAGIEQIILDLGFGFAKTLEQNYELFASINRFKKFGYPILVGISRKSMIYKPLGVEAGDSLTGTSLLNWEALRRGANILRVHDTLEAAHTISMFSQFKNYLL